MTPDADAEQREARFVARQHTGEVVESEHFVAGRYSHSPEYGFMQSDITLRVRQPR